MGAEPPSYKCPPSALRSVTERLGRWASRIRMGETTFPPWTPFFWVCLRLPLTWSGMGPVAQPVFKTGEVWQPQAG